MAISFREALLRATGGPKKPSLKAVAESTGVSYEQLKKVCQRPTAKTNVDDALKVASYFGMTLNEFLEDDLAQDRAEIARLYSALTPEVRRFLHDVSKSKKAPDPGSE